MTESLTDSGVTNVKTKKKHSAQQNTIRRVLLCLFGVGIYLLYSAVMEDHVTAFIVTLFTVGMTANFTKNVKNYHRQHLLNTGARCWRLRLSVLICFVVLFLHAAYAISLSESRSSGSEFHEQMIDAFKPIVSSLKDYIPRARNLAYGLPETENRNFALHAIVVNHIVVAVLTLIMLTYVIFYIKLSSFKEYIDSSEMLSRVLMPYDVTSYPKFRLLCYLFILLASSFVVYIYEFHFSVNATAVREYHFMMWEFFIFVLFWYLIFAFIPSIISISKKIVDRSDAPVEKLN